MSILQNLTEGVVNRDLSKEGEAILNKWEKTGLLEGLEGDFHRNQMAVLLENQAKELLRESNTMAGGDVEGFAAVAFPIVRRVFGGLLAQKLVSVQPMSLPSGLIFFMDFVKQGVRGTEGIGAGDGKFRDEIEGQADSNDSAVNPSLYGGQKVGKQLLGGVELNPDARGARPTPQFQDLVQGFSAAKAIATGASVTNHLAAKLIAQLDDDDAEKVDFDADILAQTDRSVEVVDLTVAGAHQLAEGAIRSAVLLDSSGVPVPGQARRLTKLVSINRTTGAAVIRFTVVADAAGGPAAHASLVLATSDVEIAISDNLTEGSALGAIVGTTAWEMEGSAALPEIAIKVDSAAITAMTRKLKASWTPELAQDLNAYHNLDAEVELTGILSEQIALEIDQEILADLIAGASASKLYWSRRPGLFVNRLTGKDATSLASPPDFTGSVSEWYETLVETINDVSADIHRKTLRGGANFLVCGPEVANILEFTSGFRASVTHDDATGSVGAVQIGSINKKWDLHVDPYFPRNVILVGRKGGSFLESGFVYAPYVPLQVTPTIFDTEDFTPRKAVMTRYGKKMVRPDMYGLVVVRDLEG